ncbi:hypothetical protein SUGI_0141950 [Cryptomeria japonica]|nr:hypothetical protein SUGI_0141950 [Cryptomeria japonica]
MQLGFSPHTLATIMHPRSKLAHYQIYTRRLRRGDPKIPHSPELGYGNQQRKRRGRSPSLPRRRELEITTQQERDDAQQRTLIPRPQDAVKPCTPEKTRPRIRSASALGSNLRRGTRRTSG